MHNIKFPTLIRLVIIANFLFILSSCGGADDKSFSGNAKSLMKVGTGSVKNIEVGKSNLNSIIETEKLIDKVSYIKLATSADHLIGGVNKILFFKDLIYILDRFQSSSLFVFKKDGTFVNQIFKKGKGPGEYILLSDFAINEQNGELILWDEISAKIMKYSTNDFSFISEKRLDYRFHYFTYIGPNRFVLFNNSLDNFNKPDINGYNIALVDSSFDLKGKALAYRPIESRLRLYSDGNILKSSPGKVLYSPKLADSLYQVDEKGISGKYFIDLKNLAFQADAFPRNQNEDVMLQRLETMETAFLIGDAIESPNYLCFSLEFKGATIPFYYSKTTGKLISGNRVVDNHLNSIALINPITNIGDTLVSVINSVDVKKIEGSWSSPLINKGNGIRQFAKTVNEEDNPVLMFYTLKKF